MLPKPLQQPHPPVWMAATSESAIDWAAGRGFSILMDPHCTHAELASKRTRYGEQMAAAGLADGGRDIPMARLIAVADSAEQAEAIARRGAELDARLLHRPAAPATTRSAVAAVDPVERYVNEVIIHGTPDAVVDQIQALQETASLNYLLCAPLSQDSFTLLTDEILPAIS